MLHAAQTQLGFDRDSRSRPRVCGCCGTTEHDASGTNHMIQLVDGNVAEPRHIRTCHAQDDTGNVTLT